jgi:hypothetical protein
MIEGLITKFITDKLIEELTQQFINKAGTEGIEEARRWFMKQPGLAKYLTNPIIKKLILDAAPEEIKPILRGMLSSEAIKDLSGLSKEELEKKVNDKSWWQKFLDGSRETIKNAIEFFADIQGDPVTTRFIGPATIGIGALPGKGDALLNPTPGVKSVTSSGSGKFRKVASRKFIKVSQAQDDFMPNFELDKNFKDNALKNYQKIVDSDASDREKSIMLNYLINNMQNEVSPALSYIKEYFPEIYSQYESKFK